MAKAIPAVIRVLKTARNILAKERGWIQRRYSNKRGGYCASGAIESAAYREKAKGAAYTVRMLVESGLRKPCKRDIISYNDAPGRKQEQIVTLFDRAIARAEKLAAKGKL